MKASIYLNCKIICYFSFWLTSLCIQALGSSASPELPQIHSFYGWIIFHNIFSIHSSINGHLVCVHALAIVNSTAVNIGIHVSFSVNVFSGYPPIKQSSIKVESFKKPQPSTPVSSKPCCQWLCSSFVPECGVWTDYVVSIICVWASLLAQRVKNPPAMWEF